VIAELALSLGKSFVKCGSLVKGSNDIRIAALGWCPDKSQEHLVVQREP